MSVRRGGGQWPERTSPSEIDKDRLDKMIDERVSGPRIYKEIEEITA
jgi:hypothetical protein